MFSLFTFLSIFISMFAHVHMYINLFNMLFINFRCQFFFVYSLSYFFSSDVIFVQVIGYSVVCMAVLAFFLLDCDLLSYLIFVLDAAFSESEL